MMVVSTSYCAVAYPFAFSDIIHVAVGQEDHQEALVFSAYLNETEYPVYSLIFGDAGEVPLGTLTMEDGTVCAITAQIFEVDSTIDADTLISIYAVQETVNDVIKSLNYVDGFVLTQ